MFLARRRDIAGGSLERGPPAGKVGLAGGFDGGLAKSLADVSVHVGSAQGDYGVVEDAHLVACHMVAEGLRVGNTPIHDSEG